MRKASQITAPAPLTPLQKGILERLDLEAGSSKRVSARLSRKSRTTDSQYALDVACVHHAGEHCRRFGILDVRIGISVVSVTCYCHSRSLPLVSAKTLCPKFERIRGRALIRAQCDLLPLYPPIPQTSDVSRRNMDHLGIDSG